MDPEKDRLVKMLNELKDAIEDGNEKKIKDTIDWFHENLERNKQLLSELVTSRSQCITQTDLILSACRTRDKQADIIFNLLKEYEILDQLPGAKFDDPEVIKERTETFKQALVLDTFCMVEILYDYWCGDLHWIGHNIEKLKTLRKSLEDARVVCKVDNQTRLVEIQSLIEFNTFQHELYSSLPELDEDEKRDPRKITLEKMTTMLKNVFSTYKEYSDLEKVRIPHSDHQHELELKACFNDETNKYYQWLGKCMYELYFRKLAFNVAWLIMENSFVLRKHLKERFNKPTQYFTDNSPGLSVCYTPVEDVYRNAVSLYNESESALFHYIYRTCEDWRLYLSRNRQRTVENHTGIHSGQKINLVITYDKSKLSRAPLLFLEHEKFQKSVSDLKIILEEHVIRDDPAKNWMNRAKNKKITTLLDDNYLTTSMYMSDYYSLRKIVYYIEAIEGTNGINVLMIERALQVIGEMLKNTKQSNHIMESTKSLLVIAISMETIQYLHGIREFLSHADEGQVSTRINRLKNNQTQIFVEIMEDLKVIKTRINLVLNINEHLMNKLLLEKGLSVLDEQIKRWPVNDSGHVDEIYRRFKKHGKELFLKSKPYHQELKALTGLRTPLLKEIPWVIDLKNEILSKLQLTKTSISNQVVNILPLNIRNIRQTLQLITDNQSYVNLIKPQLLQLPEFNAEGLSIGDHGENINLIKDKMPEWFKNNNTVVINLVTLNKIKDFSSHWDHITTMLSFCLNDSQLFAPDDPIRQVNVNDKDTVKNILLAKLEGKKGNAKCTFGQLKKNHSFNGIEKLHNISVKTKAPGLPRTAANARDQGRRVRQDLIMCLNSRVKLLKVTLGYPQHIPETVIAPSVQLLQWYKYKKEFRLEIEMILADIGNILVACNIKNLMIKSAKSQRDTDLRNVLHHGNPFIEVIGDVFDSNDLATEMLSKAIMFAKDGDLIEALFKLFQSKITSTKHEKGKIQKLMKTLKEEFKNNERLDSYLQLITI